MNIQINPKSLSQIVKNQINLNIDFWNKYELLESPIEEIVFERLHKYKNDNAVLIPQKTIKTISGNFRPDIILKINDKQIVIECDGKEFHKDKYYDEWRDSMILVSSEVQSIFRLRGKDIYTDLDDIIFYIAQKERDFFNQDLINRLKPSIRPEFINLDRISDYYVEKRIEYDDKDQYGQPIKRMVEITWRNISKSFDRLCVREILIAYLNPGLSIQKLISLRKEKEISTDKLFDLFYEKYPEYKQE